MERATEYKDLEEAFSHHVGAAAKVREAYAEVNKDVFADLGASDLAPFAEILSRHEDVDLNTTELIENMRSSMTEILSKINEHFFDSNNVDNKLIMLEMLKEKFAGKEGTDWNAQKLKPEERTLGIRMRNKDSSIRFMENQIKEQNEALKIAMKEVERNRKRIQDIQNDRVKLNALMKMQLEQYAEIEPELSELNKKLDENM